MNLKKNNGFIKKAKNIFIDLHTSIRCSQLNEHKYFFLYFCLSSYLIGPNLGMMMMMGSDVGKDLMLYQMFSRAFSGGSGNTNMLPFLLMNQRK